MTIHVELLGGACMEGKWVRTVQLADMCGRVERILEGLPTPLTPSGVSRVLVETIARIGERPMSMELARDLCVADRQLIMLRLGADLLGERAWLSVPCDACGERFDVGFSRLDVPFKPAGGGFPCTQVELGAWTVNLRVPNGGDQEAIADLPAEAAVHELARRCLSSDDVDSEDLVNALDEAQWRALEERVDDISPELRTDISTQCPYCGAKTQVPFDPYCLRGALEAAFNDLDTHVHLIASRYHWREDDILDLPTRRRRAYVRLIERTAANA